MMQDIPSGSELSLDLFPILRSGGAAQILFLVCSKDDPADNRGKFAYGACAVLLNSNSPDIFVSLTVSIQLLKAL